MTFTERMKKSIFGGGLSGKAPSVFRRVHYEFIAHILSNEQPGKPSGEPSSVTYREWLQITNRFADEFVPIKGFDKARFLKACGVKP